MASLDIGLKHKKQNKRSSSAVNNMSMNSSNGNCGGSNNKKNTVLSYASIVQSTLPKTIANRSSSVIPHAHSNSMAVDTSKVKKRGPNTVTKVLGFDKRNELTFESEYAVGAGGNGSGDANAKRWSVDEMFKANAKLTGRGMDGVYVYYII